MEIEFTCTLKLERVKKMGGGGGGSSRERVWILLCRNGLGDRQGERREGSYALGLELREGAEHSLEVSQGEC